MRISDEFEQTGNWLFKRRGILPLLILPLVLVALRDSEYFERFGNTVQTLWEVFCIGLSFLGLFIRALTLGWVREGTSGRNTQSQVAEELNTSGIYSIVRHPLYLGNFFIIFGMILFIQVWWLALIYALLFWIFYERIMFAEESFLERKFGDSYRDWARKTPIFFPDFRKWQKPKYSFSMRMILKREYSTFFGIIVGFILVKFFAELIGEHQLEFRIRWLVFFTLGALVYFVLRFLRKKTDFLKVNKNRR